LIHGRKFTTHIHTVTHTHTHTRTHAHTHTHARTHTHTYTLTFTNTMHTSAVCRFFNRRQGRQTKTVGNSSRIASPGVTCVARVFRENSPRGKKLLQGQQLVPEKRPLVFGYLQVGCLLGWLQVRPWKQQHTRSHSVVVTSWTFFSCRLIKDLYSAHISSIF
jgi:hypothetical protein